MHLSQFRNIKQNEIERDDVSDLLGQPTWKWNAKDADVSLARICRAFNFKTWIFDYLESVFWVFLRRQFCSIFGLLVSARLCTSLRGFLRHAANVVVSFRGLPFFFGSVWVPLVFKVAKNSESERCTIEFGLFHEFPMLLRWSLRSKDCVNSGNKCPGSGRTWSICNSYYPSFDDEQKEPNPCIGFSYHLKWYFPLNYKSARPILR